MTTLHFPYVLCAPYQDPARNKRKYAVMNYSKVVGEFGKVDLSFVADLFLTSTYSTASGTSTSPPPMADLFNTVMQWLEYSRSTSLTADCTFHLKINRVFQLRLSYSG